MMKNAARWMILCPLILLNGCATPEPIVQFETVEVTRDRYVSIPDELTQHGELVELPETVDTLGLGAAYKMQRVRAQQCYGQLDEIRAL
jgi:hypothetical protein